MMSIFGLSGVLAVLNGVGLGLAAPALALSVIAAPAPYPTAQLAQVLNLLATGL
ncbi:MAG: hypothetical protein AAF626_16530 [Pseudomonadota bacterium]